MEALNETPCFVGIDVSKKTLDICILPQKERFQVENGPFTKLCQRFKKVNPALSRTASSISSTSPISLTVSTVNEFIPLGKFCIFPPSLAVISLYF